MEIYGTLGPACANACTLQAMFAGGMTGLRLNLSHRTLADSAHWLDLAQQAAQTCGKSADVLIDLQGPELRVGHTGLPLELTAGQTLPLDRLCLPQTLQEHLAPGQILLLDDARLQLTVLGDTCRVDRGGTLLPRKSVAAPGVEIQLPALSPADLDNLSMCGQMGVSVVMQSFVRGREDLLELRRALAERGLSHIRLFAKVESLRGLETLPRWIDLADMVVIARGDLGTALPLWQLPAAQKHIAALCRRYKKPFMVVTQLLASMEQAAVPTRAEVSDIFNAVLDGASALMLTGETAAGQYPRAAMDMLCKTALAAENYMKE